MLTSDNELLARYVHRGDEASFEELIRRHASMVLLVSRNLLWRREDAEDVFQAVFALLSTKGPKLLNHQSLGGWLHVVAMRKSLQLRRQIARSREVEMLDEPVKPLEPWQAIAESRDRELLHREIARLPSRYREVIVLYHFEGKSRSQIAQTLDSTTSAVKAILARARQTLRQRLVHQGIGASIVIASCAIGSEGKVSASETLIQSTVDYCHGRSPAVEVGNGPHVVDSLITKDISMAFGILKNASIAATCAATVCLVSIAAIAGGFPQDAADGEQPNDNFLVVRAEAEEVEGGEEEGKAVVIGRIADNAERPKPPVPPEAPARVQVFNAGAAQAVAVEVQAIDPLRAPEAPAVPEAQWVPEFAVRSPAGQALNLMKVTSNGERIRYKKLTQKTVHREQEYTVMIRGKKGDVVQVKPEVRRRMIPVKQVKEEDALFPTDQEFENVAGDKLAHDDVVKQIGDKPTTMIILAKQQELPEDYLDILKPNVIVLRTDNPSHFAGQHQHAVVLSGPIQGGGARINGPVEVEEFAPAIDDKPDRP